MQKPKQDKIRKILVIQIRPYGDVLLSTSYLEALRQKYPHAEIDFFVSEPFHEVLYRNPYVDRVLVSPRKGNLSYFTGRFKLLLRVLFSNYDLVIDQQANAGSRAIVLISHAKYRLGYEKSKSKYLYNLKAKRNEPRYAACSNFDMLGPLGIEEKPFRLDFFVRESSFEKIDSWLEENGIEKEKLIVFSPGSSNSRKAWSARCFASLADELVRTFDVKIVIVWAPNEYEAASEMKRMMKESSFLIDRTNYNEAAALVKRARMLICNDGGLNHLSVALETPSLAMFGVTPPQYWSPQGAFKYHYHLFRPGHNSYSDNTWGITPQEAYEKAKSVFMELGIPKLDHKNA